MLALLRQWRIPTLSTCPRRDPGILHPELNHPAAPPSGRITFKEFLAMYAGLLLPQQLYGQEMRVAAGRGDARRVEEFMRRGCDARYADGKGWTAIHYAAEYDHPAIIKLIQDLSVQLTEERRQILQDAARRSQAAEAAAAAAAEAASASGSKRSTAGKTVLRSARSKASAAEEEEAEAAVPGPPPAGPGDLVDIDAPDKQGWTPLATACSAGHLRVVRLLLSLGADAGSVCCSGLTPLHSAASGGHVAIMTALLEAGAEVAARDMSGFTPLHLAAMGDAGDACTLLLSRGAPVTGHDALDVLGHPPSSYAHGAPSDPTSTAGILAAAEAKADAAGASQAAAAAASGGADHK